MTLDASHPHRSATANRAGFGDSQDPLEPGSETNAPAKNTLESVEAIAAAVEGAEADDEQLEDYIADLMKRLGGGATVPLPNKPAEARAGAEAPPAKPKTEPAPPRERVQRPPERAEVVSALRDVANQHARSVLTDHQRKGLFRALLGRWTVAALASLSVAALLVCSKTQADKAYYAAWGAHLIAVGWLVRYWAGVRRLRHA